MEEPVFNVNNLDEQQLGHMEFMVNSPQYTDTIRPFLEGCERMYTQLLLNPDPSYRSKYGGTDYLRCGANNMRKFIEFLDNLITEGQEARYQRAPQLSDEENYEQFVQLGKIRVAGQVTPVDDGYPADADF